MRTHSPHNPMKSLILSLMLFAGGVCTLVAGEPPSDLDRAQGIWQVFSLTEKGKAVPAKEIENLEVIILKDLFSVVEKDKPLVHYVIKIDSGKTPKTIDFTPRIVESKDKKTDKKETPTTELGIYAFDKDQLTLAIDEDGKARPTALEGKATETCSVMVLKRKISAKESK